MKGSTDVQPHYIGTQADHDISTDSTEIPLYITVPDLSIMCWLVVSVAYLTDDSVVVERDNRKKLDTLSYT